MNARQTISPGRFLLLAGALWALALGPAASRAQAPAPQVDFTLVMEEGFPATSMRSWAELVQGTNPAGLQVRMARGAESPALQTAGTAERPLFRVTAVLTARGEMLVPGGRFTLRDQAALKNWISKLVTEGPARAQGGPRLAFGLTAEELKAVHDDLAQKVPFPTKDLSTRQVVDGIAGRLKHGIVSDAPTADTLARGEKFGDELQGVTAGTALAIVLRPHGLALTPTRNDQRQVEYLIAGGKQATEAWPVGWEPQRAQADVLPMLFESLNVEVADIPVGQVVDVVGQRLKAPMLYDHLSLARAKIDPAASRVTLPPGRTAYSLALKKLLNQAKLTYELRVDEADQPLIWIRAANE